MKKKSTAKRKRPSREPKRPVLKAGWRPPRKPGPVPRKVTTPTPALPHHVEKGADVRIVARHSPKWHQFNDQARLIFVEQHKPLSEIGKLLPVSLAALEKWCRDGRWVQQREMLRSSPQGHVEDVALMLAQLIENAKAYARQSKKLPANFFDDVAKGAKAIELLRGDSFFNSHLVRVLELFKSFLETTGKKDLLDQFSEILSPFTVYAMNAGK